MKHAIAAFSLFLLMLICPVDGRCAASSGSWYVYPSFANPPQKVIDTDHIVYFTSGGSLFSFDKKNNETYSYTTQNKLTDTDITDIYYNHQRHYLVVCYASGNIDLLYDDGTMKNLSDISDSSIPAPLTIKDVCFDGNDIYVATVFGIVKFNEQRGEVVTSGNYGKPINAVAVMGDWLVVHYENSMRRAPKTSLLSDSNVFSPMYGSVAPIEMWADTDESLIVLINESNGMLSRHSVSPATGSLKSRKILTANHSKRPAYTCRSSSGDVYYMADNKLYSLTSSPTDPDDISEMFITDLPEDICGGAVGTCEGGNSVWSLTRDGLGNYAFDGEGGITVMMDRYKPEGISVSLVRYFYPSKDEKRLYIQNSGITNYRFGGSTRGLEYAQTATMLDLVTGEYEDVTAYPVEGQVPVVINQQKTKGLYAISPVGITEDPNDRDVRFVGTADDGIYKVRGTTVVGRYGHTNSPLLLNDNRDIFYACQFDNYGNLWTMMNTMSYTNSPIAILPADKVKLNPDQVTEHDWIHPDLLSIGYLGGQDVRFLFCRKSTLVVVVSTGSRILVWDHRGTGNDFSDDRYVYLGNTITDQDGNVFSNYYKTALCEDNNGNIWVGTDEGIIEINPAKVFQTNPTFTHVKLPRNDGTNLADYLLGSDFSVDISVDAANRKWIATSTSGVFCVSPNGDEIIHNFNTENSPLPTNVINCIYADKNTGTIYIGTDHAMFSYSSDASAPRDNYDDMLIYPNPVRPETRGHVTISGLMDNSLVKIADASGNVIYQGRSEGGSMSWNVCNSAGVRVPTGVYYVFVSQNTSGSSGAVGKIMVVN